MELRSDEKSKLTGGAKKRKIEQGQRSIAEFVSRPKSSMTLKQSNFNERLVDFIVYSLKPYNTVEDKYFIDLVHSLDNNVNVISRKKLMSEISKRAQADKDQTVFMLREAKYVATSADIWSCSRHGYMGVTITAILPSFKRVSRAIACRHFENPHSGARIASLLLDVHEESSLGPPRLVASVTDNGSNIVSAHDIAGIDTIEDRDRFTDPNIVELLKELNELDKALPSHFR